jgi:hypothetical protein
MKSGFAIFDAHTHTGLARHSGRRLSSAELIARMDHYGVDRAVVIPFPVVDDRRQAHGEIARAVCNYPDRLAAVACLDPFMPLEKFQASLVDYLYRSGLRAWSRRLPGMLVLHSPAELSTTVAYAHTVSGGRLVLSGRLRHGNDHQSELGLLYRHRRNSVGSGFRLHEHVGQPRGLRERQCLSFSSALDGQFQRLFSNRRPFERGRNIMLAPHAVRSASAARNRVAAGLSRHMAA